MAASPKEKFEAAVKVIQTLPKNGSFQPSHGLMLKFYAYYKQATIGPCDIPRPAFWDVVGKAKWDAWNELGDMSRDDAMVNYVDSLKKAFEGVTYDQIVEAMPHTDMVQGFVEKLGNFYELVDSAAGKAQSNGDIFPKLPLDSLRSVAKGVTKQMAEKAAAEEGVTKEDDALGNGDNEDDNITEEDREVSEHLIGSNGPVPAEAGKTPNSLGDTPRDSPHLLPVHDEDRGTQTPIKVNGINGSADHLIYAMNGHGGKAQLNGGSSYHDNHEEDSYDSNDDDDEEFCDTSDLPQETQAEIIQYQEETLLKRPFDPTYIPGNEGHHGYSPPSHQPTLHRDVSATDIMRREQSSSMLYVSPQQLTDRDWSSASLAMDYGDVMTAAATGATGNGSRGDIVDMMTSRGGAGNGDEPLPPGRGGGGGRRGSGGNGGGQGRGGLMRGGNVPPGRSQLMAGAGGAGGSGGGGGRGQQQPYYPPATEVNDQIALALVRLQQDMSSVITRLHTLESLTLAHQQLQRSRQSSERSSHSNQSSSWWRPFPNLPGRTLFLVLVWPVVVHLILQFIANRRRNRRR